MEMNHDSNILSEAVNHTMLIDMNSQRELFEVLNQFLFSIIRVDLLTDTAFILQSKDQPNSISQEFNWTEYLNHYRSFLLMDDDSPKLERLSSKSLLELSKKGENHLSVELSYLKNGVINWLTTSVFLRHDDTNKNYAYLMAKKSTKDHLLKSIIDLYVYSNCDYFICLDAKNNSYTMFSGTQNGATSPPEKSDDYTTEMIKYAETFVAPEDREMVIWEMGVERMLGQLEKKGVHSLYCGVIDPVRGYTRKRLEYRYYNRDTQMVLLIRTDITDMYEEEQERNRLLTEALTRAQTDMLTGLLNYQGMVEKVSYLLGRKSSKSAFLFIDLDNFKHVNDTLGHEAGNRLLCRVADTLRRETRDEDLVGRVGGDEFVVLILKAKSLEDIKKCAQRLCNSICLIDTGLDFGSGISCSIGISIAPDDGNEYKTLARKADALVYRAKFEGKNRFII